MILSGAPRQVCGVGHSMGGAGLVLTELRRPGALDAMVLVEPILFHHDRAPDRRNELADRTSRRRASWCVTRCGRLCCHAYSYDHCHPLLTSSSFNSSSSASSFSYGHHRPRPAHMASPHPCPCLSCPARPSESAAREYFLARALFQRWAPSALEGYIRGGLRSVHT
jgi:pimeloyl-ACP methyl ester carboxylesterase